MKDIMSELEYIRKFKELCEDCDRYTNSINVKKHNRAQTKLDNMFSSVEDDPEFMSNVYKVLLHDTDGVVRHYSADHCLHAKLYTDEAIAVLEDLSENAELLMTRVGAGMLLFVLQNPPEKYE